MPWSTPTLVHRVSAIATTMAILTTTSLKAQEEAPKKKDVTVKGTAIIKVDREEKEKSSATYEVKDGKITITADEGTSPAELIQLIMKETGGKEKNVFVYENRFDVKGDALFKTLPPVAGMTAAPAAEAKPRYVLGIEVAPVPDPVRSHLKLDHGLMVTNVVPEKPAAVAGIKANDILINVVPVPDQPAVELKVSKDLAEQVTKSGEAGTTLTLKIIKDGAEENVTLAPAKEDRPAYRVFMSTNAHGGPAAMTPGVHITTTTDAAGEAEALAVLKERMAADKIVQGHAFQAVPAFPAQTQYSFALPQGFKSFEEKNAELQASLEKLQAQQAELIKKMEELNKKLEAK